MIEPPERRQSLNDAKGVSPVSGNPRHRGGSTY
jgi:hypothetical protein